MAAFETLWDSFPEDLNNFKFNVLIVLATITIICYRIWSSPKGLPPGPTGLPIFGYLPFLGKKPHLTFTNLTKKYGPIFSLYLGNRLIIVLNDYDSIKEAFVKQGEVFAGRPSFVRHIDNYSIPLCDGKRWKTHRRFAFNLFRDLGVGKLSIEPSIMEEIHQFLTELKKYNGKPTDFSQLLTSSVSNNICILLFGKRFEYDDPWFIFIQHLIHEVTANSSATGAINFLPWLKKLPLIARLVNQAAFVQHLKEFEEEFYRQLKERKEHHIDGLRDNYINAFIDEQRARQKKSKDGDLFQDKALEQNVRFLLAGGSDTVANTILWCIIFLVKNPKVQRKVQEEIDMVIGTERTPCWNDRIRMPYTEATINEVQRIQTLVPTNIPHRNTENCELFGYKIPKDSHIYSNLYAVHNDKKLWKNPEQFSPDRFLLPNGKMDKKEHLIPFSIGKRECLGVSLAMMELHLYLTAMLQNFTFRSPDGSAPNMEPQIGLNVGPKYFNIIADLRNTTNCTNNVGNNI